MALIDQRAGSITAPDGSVCTITITTDSRNGNVDHITVVNGTPLTAHFWFIRNAQQFDASVAPGATQVWNPPPGATNWNSDHIEFGWGFVA